MCPQIFTEEDRKKILENFENKNTVLYNSALLEQRNFCVELGYIPLNLNAKKIFHDVDIVLVDVYDTFEQKISVGCGDTNWPTIYTGCWVIVKKVLAFSKKIFGDDDMFWQVLYATLFCNRVLNILGNQVWHS